MVKSNKEAGSHGCQVAIVGRVTRCLAIVTDILSTTGVTAMRRNKNHRLPLARLSM